MTGKPKTRTFSLPGDLDKLGGIVQANNPDKVRWTQTAMERQLAVYEAGALPDEMAEHMQDLRKACAWVRKFIATGDIEGAARRMEGVETLARDMQNRMNKPYIERGVSFSDKPTGNASAQRRRDGNATNATLAAKAREVLASGNGFHKSGGVNIAELARQCRESAPHLSQSRVRHILGEAANTGKLAIRPTK